MCFPDKADGALFQGVATRIGGLLCLNFGLLFGITSSHILLYQSSETPLSRIIDVESASLLGAYLCLGGILGALLFGYVSDKTGPKSALLLCGLLQMGCWGCILFGYNINHIYSSRVIGGIAGGGTFAVLPTYIRDIAEEKNRHSLESTIDTMRNFGIICGFILASFTPYNYLPVICICEAFLFSLCFPFMPESPYYFVRKGDVQMMTKSLRWFRGIRQLEDHEKPEFLVEVKNFVEQHKNRTKYNEVMSSGYKIRLVAISAILVITSQFCGIYLVFNYGEIIFQEMRSPIPAHWSAIILASVQWVGSLLGSSIQGLINRKILLCVSTLISGLSLLALAVGLNFEGLIPLNAEQMEWFPLGFLTLHIFIASIGFYPLMSVVIAEIAPPKIRGYVTALAMSFMWLLALLFVKFYYDLVDLMGFAGLLWIFAGSCLFQFLFTMCFIPETRGKEFEEISIRMGGWSKSITK